MLTIEIKDMRNIRVLWDGKFLGAIQSITMHASADNIDPVLKVVVPEVLDSYSGDLKKTLGCTIEAIQAHGGQVEFMAGSDFQMDSNPEGQGDAEAALKEQVIGNGS